MDPVVVELYLAWSGHRRAMEARDDAQRAGYKNGVNVPPKKLHRNDGICRTVRESRSTLKRASPGGLRRASAARVRSFSNPAQLSPCSGFT